MKTIIILLCLITLSYSQFNMTAFTSLPSLYYSEDLACSAIRKNATEVYASIKQGAITKIVKWNTTTPTNTTRIGQYVAPISTPVAYGYLYFVKGYILANSVSSKVHIFNETTYTFIGQFNANLTFGRGEFIQSKDVFFFGTPTGNVGYLSLNSLPNVNPVFLFNQTSNGFVFLQKSNDEKYVSVSFMNTNYFLVYQTTDWGLFKNVTIPSFGIYTHAWSGDSRYLMIFPYDQIYVLVYDRDTIWGLIKNQTIGYSNIRTCFYYQQTNVVVALSELSSSVFLISFYDYSVTFYCSINGYKMYMSDTKESIVIFDYASNTSWYFKINKYCRPDQFYDMTIKRCVQCGPHCSLCNSSATCQKCITNYTVVNGSSCQICPLRTVYNTSTQLCDSCGLNCLNCRSSYVCSGCVTGGYLVNGSCVICDLGYVYNYTKGSCEVNCSSNCQTCASDTSCLFCVSGFNLMSNGSCLTCGLHTFYDSLGKTCQTCPQNCDSCPSAILCYSCVEGAVLSNGLCIFCSNHCVTCISSSICIQCQSGFTNNLGQCFNLTTNNQTTNNETTNNETKNQINNETIERTEAGIMFDKMMKLTIQSDTIFFINKVPGSRRVLQQTGVFFLCFDHIWLYIYHKRTYGEFVNRFLKSVQTLQQEKWNVISEQVLGKTRNIDFDNYGQYLNYKIYRTSWKYIEIEGRASSFWANSLQYIFLNVPLVLTLFFILKMLFHLLFKFQLSLIFRQYAFKAYILLMLLQGNSQSFTYMLMFDSRQLIQQNYYHKLLNVLTMVMFAIVITYLMAGFFMIKARYNKETKYFYDNCSNTLEGSLHMLIKNGLLNFCLGAVHMMTQNYYMLQLALLCSIEILYICSIIVSIVKSKVYSYKYIEWQNAMSSFLRIALIFTFYIDRNYPGVYVPIQQTQMHIIMIYIFNAILSTLSAILILVKKAFMFLRKRTLRKPTYIIHSYPNASKSLYYSRNQSKSPFFVSKTIGKQNKLKQKQSKFTIQLMVPNCENATVAPNLDKLKISEYNNNIPQPIKYLKTRKLKNLPISKQKPQPSSYKQKKILLMPNTLFDDSEQTKDFSKPKIVAINQLQNSHFGVQRKIQFRKPRIHKYSKKGKDWMKERYEIERQTVNSKTATYSKRIKIGKNLFNKQSHFLN